MKTLIGVILCVTVLSCSRFPLDPSLFPRVTITHPNSGDTFRVGETIPIRWRVDETIWAVTISLSSLETRISTRIAVDVPADAREFRYIIPGNIPDGPYKIHVRRAGQTWSVEHEDEVGPIYIRNRKS